MKTRMLLAAAAVALAAPAALAQQPAPPPGQQPSPQRQAQPGDGADVIVRQGQPQVEVQQYAPEVQVRRGQPDVSVDQGRPQVDVRRAQPDVGVAKPQAPARPEVTQADPQVRFTRAEPNIRYESEQPQVTVEPPQGKPKVTVQRMDWSEGQLARSGLDRGDLVGMDVVGANGEEVGEVGDLLLEPGSNRIRAAVVSVDQGFLGMDEKRVEVPWKQVQLRPEAGQVRVGMTGDQLRDAPAFRYGPKTQALVGPDGQQ